MPDQSMTSLNQPKATYLIWYLIFKQVTPWSYQIKQENQYFRYDDIKPQAMRPVPESAFLRAVAEKTKGKGKQI